MKQYLLSNELSIIRLCGLIMATAGWAMICWFIYDSDGSGDYCVAYYYQLQTKPDTDTPQHRDPPLSKSLHYTVLSKFVTLEHVFRADVDASLYYISTFMKWGVFHGLEMSHWKCSHLGRHDNTTCTSSLLVCSERHNKFNLAWPWFSSRNAAPT